MSYTASDHARRLVQFDQVKAEGRALFDERNQRYEDAFAENGVVGVIEQLNGVLRRLRPLRRQLLRAMYSSYPEEESLAESMAQLEEVLNDAGNYAAMGRICLMEGNLDGK